MARRQSKSLKRRVVQLVDEGKAEDAYNFLVEKKWVPTGSGYQRHCPTGLELFVEVDETRQILKSTGRSPRYWAWELPGPYPLISDEEIIATEDGLKAGLMLMANLTLKDAAEQAAGVKIREPQFHEDGWDIAITTPAGIVGLWSCWLGNQFYLGYPKPIQIIIDRMPNEAILKIGNGYYERNRDRFLFPQKEPLSYEEARRLCIGFSWPEFVSQARIEEVEIYEEAHTDVGFFADDQLVMDVLGVECAVWAKHFALGCKEQMRRWAEFYGPQLEGGGRVWIDHSSRHSNGFHFPVIITYGGLVEEIYYGHDYSMGIFTYPFSFYGEDTPDGPRADEGSIQPYRDKFLTLACAIAQRMGGAQHATINYGFCMVPEDLEREGYEEIVWLKGAPGRREGWGADFVRAVKGEETIILKSGNSLVPWSTIRRAPFDGGVEALKKLLTF